MISNRSVNYINLLKIRHSALRRDTTIAGGVFLLSFIALIALGLTGRLNTNSIYIGAALVTLFGMAYLTSWVKLENVKASIELIGNLTAREDS